MGYNISASTITLTAKLTPLGRQKFVSTSSNLITSFTLGDSDANYNAALPLNTGEVPSAGGNLGTSTSTTNSVAQNIAIKSMLLLDGTGATKKSVEPQSSAVTLDYISLGLNTASATTITQDRITRTNQNTDSLVNLFYSFGLPLDSNGDYNFTGLSSTYGGFADTALSALAKTDILVIGIDDSRYGEVLDGRTLKLVLTTTATTYTFYSTFQNTGMPLTVQDASYNDTARNTQFLGGNVALLFSDDIKKPNGGNASLSWSTGYNSVKPFSVNGKQLYNLQTNTNLSQTADTVVGVAYLDKGFLVITNPTIVGAFNVISDTAVATFNSISTSVVQNITCIVNRGEFGASTNPTFKLADVPRISEVGLYDVNNNLIAYAKTDRQLVKSLNEFLALGIKISV